MNLRKINLVQNLNSNRFGFDPNFSKKCQNCTFLRKKVQTTGRQKHQNHKIPVFSIKNNVNIEWWQHLAISQFQKHILLKIVVFWRILKVIVYDFQRGGPFWDSLFWVFTTNSASLRFKKCLQTVIQNRSRSVVCLWGVWKARKSLFLNDFPERSAADGTCLVTPHLRAWELLAVENSSNSDKNN